MALPQGAGLSRLAGLLADETRAGFCLALLDGRAWTAGELARHAGVVPSTASAHLNQLVDGGLLTQEHQGRHRYVRLAGPEVAYLIEQLAAHVSTPAPAPRPLRGASASRALARARTCYDHLAGRLGVAVTDAMTDRGLIQQGAGFALTDRGIAWLEALAIDVAALRSARRPLARPCLDWTERRTHLAGAAGAALYRHFLEHAWIERIGSHRAVRLTSAGRTALLDLLGIEPADLDPADPARARPCPPAAATG
jgi:DNA-binding transcriptional ArsR family regulator